MNRVTRVCLGWLLLSSLAPVGAAPQPQVLEDFATASADGRPAGWDVVGVGAEATLKYNAEAPGSMRVEYKFNDPNGVIYLLGKCRFRVKPWSVELTVKAGGGEILGLLVRDAVSNNVFESRATTPLKESGWATRSIEPKFDAPNGAKVEGLDGGGGLRLDGLTLRQGEGAAATGTLEFRDIVASCDVNPQQAAMIDIALDRYDRVYIGEEPVKAQLLVTGVAGENRKFDVSYTVTDLGGQTVGQGSSNVACTQNQLTRVPVTFTPPRPFGYYTIKAEVKGGGSERHATARFCVVPATPPGEGRHIGLDVTPRIAPNQEWFDIVLWRTLVRAGVGYARVVLRWADVEPQRGTRNWEALDHDVQMSKLTGLPLVLSVVEAPGWIYRQGAAELGPAFIDFVSDAARHAGETVAGWELWRQPNTARYWPPEPQPYAFRELLDATAKSLKAAGRPVPVASGGLLGFERGFVGTMFLGGTPPVDRLGLALPRARQAFPFLDADHRPSIILDKTLQEYREWAASAQRKWLAPWVVDAGVRTSPVEESKVGQALELARCAALARGSDGALFWHEALDGDDPADRYGVIRRDLEPKPALAAIAGSAASSHGMKLLVKSKGTPQVFLMKSAKGFGAVVYGAGLSLPEDVKAFDLWGNPITDGNLGNGDTPVYLAGPGVMKLMGR